MRLWKHSFGSLVAVALLLVLSGSAMGQDRFCGDPKDIVLQGFHWGSWDRDANGKSWYSIIQDNAKTIRENGFTWVWFPPPSDSVAPQGYMPRRWNQLSSKYGTEAELKAAIAALAPTQAMADVVVNHRCGVNTTGPDFEDPAFADNANAVTRDDPTRKGSGNLDSGEDMNAALDLDHTNASVQAEVKAYLNRLAQAGFRGWRYDMVRGYDGKFTGLYNDASLPAMSIGENWDDSPHQIDDWIGRTGSRSAAFDFPTRRNLFEAISRNDFVWLKTIDGKPTGLIGAHPRAAVTFLDNHDTEWRRAGQFAKPFEGDRNVQMGYAYILTHPGVPSVFWSHFFDWGQPTRDIIIQLIKIRQTQGVSATSVVNIQQAKNGLYAAIVDGKIAVKLGTEAWSPGAGWPINAAVSGRDFAVWVKGP